VVVEAYVAISTRKVDNLLKPLGIDGILRSEALRMCKVLDEAVEAPTA
jgi:transposase-like protein